MILTLTKDDLPTMIDHGHEIHVTGTGPDGERITFTGAPVEMGHMLVEIASGKSPALVSIKPSQILDIKASV